MKRFITMALMLLTMTIYAQDSIDSLKVSEAERIIDKYSGKLVTTFTETVQTITPLAEDAFTIVVKLQLVKGIVFLLPLLAFIIFFVLLRREYTGIITTVAAEREIFNKKLEEYRKDKDNYAKLRYEGPYDITGGPFDEKNITLFMILYLIISVITFIMALVTTYDGVTHVLVPKWYAIKEIIELF